MLIFNAVLLCFVTIGARFSLYVNCFCSFKVIINEASYVFNGYQWSLLCLVILINEVLLCFVTIVTRFSFCVNCFCSFKGIINEVLLCFVMIINEVFVLLCFRVNNNYAVFASCICSAIQNHLHTDKSYQNLVKSNPT